MNRKTNECTKSLEKHTGLFLEIICNLHQSRSIYKKNNVDFNSENYFIVKIFLLYYNK